jgi:hypothetical protein
MSIKKNYRVRNRESESMATLVRTRVNISRGVAPELIGAGIGQFGIQVAEGYSNWKKNHLFFSLKTKHITNDTYTYFSSIKEHAARRLFLWVCVYTETEAF